VKKILLLSTLVILCNVTLRAIIIESDTLTSVYDHVEKDTLVVFDVDDTIAYPAQELGSSKWIDEFMTNQFKAKGLRGKDAFDSALHLHTVMQMFVDLHVVDNSDKIIKHLQAQGVDVIAHTNRPIAMAKRTVTQLKNTGIDFSQHAIGKTDLFLPVVRLAQFTHGILFGSLNNKGDTLVCFLEKADLKPKKVIFLDDSLRNLKNVEKALANLDIAFVGIRFSGLDKHKQNFNEKQAETQTQNLLYKLGLAAS